MSLVLGPARAADLACHDEQLEVWANDVIGYLSMEGWLRDDLSYDDIIDLNEAVKREIKRIVASAFAHPEVNCIRRVR